MLNKDDFLFGFGFILFITVLILNTIFVIYNPTGYATIHGFISFLWIMIGWICIYLGMNKNANG